MNTLRTFSLGLWIAVTFFFQVPCWAAIELTGNETTPPAPAKLDVNATFSCNSNGNGLLSYEDGTHVNLKAGCEGQILSNGLRIKTGNLWVAYRKKGQHFIVATPLAVIGVRGTDFGVSAGKDTLSVVLVNGSVTITPIQNASAAVTLKPGQTYTLSSGKGAIRPSTPTDLEFWKQDIQQSPEGSSQMPSFSDQYLFGLTGFEAGSATYTVPGESTAREARQGSLIRSGSSISTASDSYARISLLCGSKILVAPNSSITVGPMSLGVKNGSCMIRHVGKAYPLKVDGTPPVLIEKHSVVEFERTGDTLLMRVQHGEARVRGSKEKISAGESAKIGAQGVSKVARGPIPLAWEDPAALTTGNAEEFGDTDIFQPGPSQGSREPAQTGSGTEPDKQNQSVASTTGDVTNLRDMLGF